MKKAPRLGRKKEHVRRKRNADKRAHKDREQRPTVLRQRLGKVDVQGKKIKTLPGKAFGCRGGGRGWWL